MIICDWGSFILKIMALWHFIFHQIFQFSRFCLGVNKVLTSLLVRSSRSELWFNFELSYDIWTGLYRTYCLGIVDVFWCVVWSWLSLNFSLQFIRYMYIHTSMVLQKGSKRGKIHVYLKLIWKVYFSFSFYSSFFNLFI